MWSKTLGRWPFGTVTVSFAVDLVFCGFSCIASRALVCAYRRLRELGGNGSQTYLFRGASDAICLIIQVIVCACACICTSTVNILYKSPLFKNLCPYHRWDSQNSGHDANPSYTKCSPILRFGYFCVRNGQSRICALVAYDAQLWRHVVSSGRSTRNKDHVLSKDALSTDASTLINISSISQAQKCVYFEFYKG